jgi:hypothetical protein
MRKKHIFIQSFSSHYRAAITIITHSSIPFDAFKIKIPFEPFYEYSGVIKTAISIPIEENNIPFDR